MLRRVIVLAASIALLAPAPAQSGSIVLDPLTDPFLSQPCIADLGRYVLCTQHFCPGACPPDSLISCPGGNGIVANFELHLPITPEHGLFRWFQLAADVPPEDDTSAEMLPDAHAFDVRDETPGRWWLYLEWQSNTWGLDLAALGATALRIPLSGEIDAGRPVYVSASIESVQDQNLQFGITVPATSAGDLVLPFAAMGLRAPASSNIDEIVLVFSDCPHWSNGDCVPGYAPRRYRIGAPSFDTEGATALPRRTWGALKAAYR